MAPGLIPPPAPAFAFEAPSFERPQMTLVSRLRLFLGGGGGLPKKGRLGFRHGFGFKSWIQRLLGLTLGP